MKADVNSMNPRMAIEAYVEIRKSNVELGGIVWDSNERNNEYFGENGSEADESEEVVAMGERASESGNRTRGGGTQKGILRPCVSSGETAERL